MTTRVKVLFRLEQDEDDYPPFAIESVWAHATDRPDEFVINNIPFFAHQATLDDRVLAERVDGEWYFRIMLVRSTNSLVRIVFHRPEETARVRGDLKALGCSSEWFESRHLIAVNIPAGVRFARVQRYLAHEEEAGTIGYEEPIIRHLEAPSDGPD